MTHILQIIKKIPMATPFSKTGLDQESSAPPYPPPQAAPALVADPRPYPEKLVKRLYSYGASIISMYLLK